MGIALTLKVDVLLAAMALGAMIVNYTPRKSKQVFQLVGKFTPPIYILFFVLFGAKFSLGQLTLPAAGLAGVYLIARSAGKALGAGLGARVSHAAVSVRRYLPMCLFSQAGVAIGLSIFAGQRFPGQIGDTIVVVITTTTFVVQMIGPVLTKLAVTKAGEVGLNVTEADLMRTSKAEDIMQRGLTLIPEGAPLSAVLKVFSENPNLYFPVVDAEDRLLGIMTIDNIKNAFMASDLGGFLLAHDLMESPVAVGSPETPVSEVKELMNRYGLEYLPVVGQDEKVVGFLEARTLDTAISTKVLQLKEQADALG